MVERVGRQNEGVEEREASAGHSEQRAPKPHYCGRSSRSDFGVAPLSRSTTKASCDYYVILFP